jgi:exportin-5
MILMQLKAGDVRLLATVAFGLVKHEQTSEIRHFGLKMLQHLIRMRWDELNPEEQHQMAIMAGNMLQESARPSEPWGLKSQAAALMAEVARREGPPLWKEMLPALFSLSSSGPIHAELVAMVLRWLPEDVTVHNEDLEGERRRNLLQGLTQTLPETLPFLYKVIIALAMQMMHSDCRYYLPHALFALFVEVCDLDCVLQQKASNMQLLSR